MKIIPTFLKDVLLLEPDVFNDERGCFFESYHEEKYTALGFPRFLQDNISYSRPNVLRGLHFQNPKTQGKLVSVIKGRAFDVVVDIRQSSPTFKKWYGVELSAENKKQLYIPPGFAHGFCVLNDNKIVSDSLTILHYKCTDYYTPVAERGIRYDDPSLNIAWPVNNPFVAAKDLQYPFLHELAADALFT